MSKSFRIAVALAVPAVLLLVGSLGGLAVNSGVTKLRIATAWSRLDSPPETPIAIVGVEGPCVAVGVASGDVYVTCDDRDGQRIQWQIQESPFAGEPSSCNRPDIPDPPGNPVALVEDCWYGETFKFALLKDGSVMSYRYMPPSAAVQVMNYLGAVLLGAIVGLLGGIALVNRVLRQRPQSVGNTKPETDPRKPSD